LEVEVDLYSGRPNPRLRLAPAAAAELMRRVAALSPLSGPARISEGLGYRGFRIEPDNDDPSVAESVISNGVVVVRDRSGAERFLADPERALERWLAETVRPTLDPQVAAVLTQQLALDT
jgi:hypothetical protein